MADISGTPPLSGRMQALCLARPIEYWDGASSGASITEQGPRPGLPVADQDSHLVPVLSGTITGTADLEMRTCHGGLPGQIDAGLQMAVRRTGDSLWMDYEIPAAISYAEQVDTVGLEPDCETLPDGTSVFVARRSTTGNLVSYARDPSTGALGGAVTIYSVAVGGRACGWPALVAVGADLYCLAWRITHDGTSAAISVWLSRDSGATWTEVQDYATTDADVVGIGTPPWAGNPGDYYGGRLRAAYRDGEVSVWAHLVEDLDAAHTGEADYLRQYAGPALTMRLDKITDYQQTYGCGWADVTAIGSGFVVAYQVRSLGVYAVVLGSAWQPISSASPALVESGFVWTQTAGSTPAVNVYTLVDDGCVGLVTDPAGLVWLYAGDEQSTYFGGGILALYSVDGITWQTTHSGNATVGGHVHAAPDGVTPDVGLDHWGVCWQHGRALLVAESFAAQAASSLWLTYLGGWSDLRHPELLAGYLLANETPWQYTWLPIESPADLAGFTETSAGTNTAALSTLRSGSLAVTTGDGIALTGQRYWTTPTSLVDRFWFEIEVAVQQGGDITADDIGIRAYCGDAGSDVRISIRLTPTQIRVIDRVAASTLTTISGLDGTAHTYQLRVGLYAPAGGGNGRVQIWYRTADSIERRQWSLLLAETALSNGGGGNTRVEWGHLILSGATTQHQSYWRLLSWHAEASALTPHFTWDDLDQAGGDNPGVVRGRSVGPDLAYAIDGTTLAARRGPGVGGETWSAPVSGDYEIARAVALDAPSPRIHHRSVDTSADVVIPWAVDADRPHVEDAEHPPLLALDMWCNWRLATLEYKTVAGAWTTAATIDTRVLQAVNYTRTGPYMRAAAATTNTYLYRDEVDPDWTVEFSDGGDPGTTRYRHPVGNSPGRWSNSTGEPRCYLELESTLAGDPTGAGQLHLWSPHVTVILAGVTATAWRLKIDSTHGTADGDYRTKIAWCEGHLLALPPSWGRGITDVPGYERADIEGGLGVRVDRAPSARELRLSWDAGLDESEIHSTAQVRYVTGHTGGDPAASLGELPLSLVRMLRRQAGRPVVWATWDRSGSSTVTIRRQHERMTATVEAAPDIEVVAGQPGSTETSRIGKMTLREVV